MKTSTSRTAAIAGAALAAGLLSMSSAQADTIGPIDFENYTVGSPDGQQGWSSDGSAGFGCAMYDHLIHTNSGAPTSFGSQSLRISSAVTSGCFGDQTFSPSTAEAAGEFDAQGGGLSAAPTNHTYVAQFDIAVVDPEAQAGSYFVVSPDRGDGARMSWVIVEDTASGILIGFNEFKNGTFAYSDVATGLSRTVPHTIRIEMELVDGVANDVVRVFVDGALVKTGTSWEQYYREVEVTSTRTVDSLLFRTGGTATPDALGKGFLIDNLTVATGVVFTGAAAPTSADQCKKGGWETFSDPSFRNQGQCVSYVNGRR